MGAAQLPPTLMKIPTLMMLPIVLPLAAAVTAAGDEPLSMDLPDLNEATALSLEEVLCLQPNHPTDDRAAEGETETPAPRRAAPHACCSTCVPDAEGRFNPVPQGLAADFILRVRAHRVFSCKTQKGRAEE